MNQHMTRGSARLGAGVIALALLGCSTPTRQWTNSNQQASLASDTQRCRTQTARLSSAQSYNTSPTATNRNPQDDAWEQSSEYEACMGKLGWHR
jgi:hypothetical protein